MAKARVKTRGVNLPVPQSRDEAASHVRRIGELERDLGRREADMNDELARIKEVHEQGAQPISEERDGLTEGLKTWAEANRSAITDGNRVKFADLGTGKISWRHRPAKVSVPKDVETILAAIRRLRLPRFIRTKEEVNREAMLAEPAIARTIPGIRIGSAGEDFVVEPFEAELSEAA